MKEIPPPNQFPAPFLQLIPSFPPCLPQKRYFKRKYINLQLIWVVYSTKNHKDCLIGYLIFHLTLQSNNLFYNKTSQPLESTSVDALARGQDSRILLLLLLLPPPTLTLDHHCFTVLLFGYTSPTPAPVFEDTKHQFMNDNLCTLPALMMRPRAHLVICKRSTV